jgi:flagella basal body P-ring formation protein FlgA
MKTLWQLLEMLNLTSLRACAGALLLAAGVGAQAASPQELMQSALVDWVAASNGVAPGQVTVAPLDSRVAVQPCAGGFSFEYPFVSRESVRVRCMKPNWQLFVKVGFTTPVGNTLATSTVTATAAAAKPASAAASTGQVVVATANLQAGQVLHPEHLKLEKLEVEKISKAHYIELAGLEGQELVRAVRAGDAIRTSDLRQATLIRRGEQVVMTIGTPQTFQISVTAEALQDGKMGEQIRLRNPESGRTLTGIVTGKGQARGV